MKPPSATFCWSIRLYLTTRRCRAAQQTIVRVVRVPPHSVAHSTLRVLSGTMGYYRVPSGTIGYYREPSGAAIAHVEVD